MFKADDYRLRLKTLSDTLSEAKYALDIDNLGEKLAALKKGGRSPRAAKQIAELIESNYAQRRCD